MAMITLILGGARSGKSALAERLIEQSLGPTGRPVYVATGQAFDDEMRDRIDRHRSRRGPRWRTVEAPLALAETIRSEGASGQPLLVDCLTLWLSNLLHAERDPVECAEQLTAALTATPAPVVLVSNEVGLGIVPQNRLAREFRDHAGRLHQTLAELADRVLFVIAGQPMTVKDLRGPALRRSKQQ